MRECATTLAAEMTAEEHDFLFELLRRERLAGRHLEIGTAAGGTLWQMIRCFDNAPPPFSVVDPMRYFPNQLDTVKKNLRDHGIEPETVDFRITTSTEAFAAAETKQERFDFILIDGSHKILPVTADLRWLRLLNPGGVLCLHDYTPMHPGVFRAVNHFLAHHKHCQILGRGESLLALRKTAVGNAPEVTCSDWFHAYAWYLPLQIHRRYQRWTRSVPK